MELQHLRCGPRNAPHRGAATPDGPDGGIPRPFDFAQGRHPKRIRGKLGIPPTTGASQKRRYRGATTFGASQKRRCNVIN